MRGKIPFPHNFTIRELREDPNHQPTVELNESKTGPAVEPGFVGSMSDLEQSPIERGIGRGLDATETLANDNLLKTSDLVREERQATDMSSKGSPAQRMATEEGSQAQKSIETIRNAVPKSSIPAPGQSRKPAGPPVQGPRKPTDPPSASESIREHAQSLTGPQALQAERDMPDSLESAPAPKLPNSGKADQGTPQDIANEGELAGRHGGGNLETKFKNLLENEEWARKTYGAEFTKEGFGMFLADQGELEGGAEAGEHLTTEELVAADNEINKAESAPEKVNPKWVGTAQEEDRATQSGRPRGMKMDAMSRWMLEKRKDYAQGAKEEDQDPDKAFEDRLRKHEGESGLTMEQLQNPQKIKDKDLRAKARAIRAAVGKGGNANTEGMDQATINELNKGLAHYLGRNTEAKKTVENKKTGKMEEVDKYSQNDLNAIVGEHVAATGDSDDALNERANITGELDAGQHRKGDGIMEGADPRYKNVRNPNTGEWELQMTQERKDLKQTRQARQMLREHIKNHPEDFTGPDGQLDEGKMRQFMEEHGAFQGDNSKLVEGDDAGFATKVFPTMSEQNRNQRQANQSSEHIRQRNLQGKDQLLRGPYHGAAHYNDQLSGLMEAGDMHSAFSLARRMGDKQTMDYITNFMDNQALVDSKRAEKEADQDAPDPTESQIYSDLIANGTSIEGMKAKMTKMYPERYEGMDLDSPEGHQRFVRDMANAELGEWRSHHRGQIPTSNDIKDMPFITEVLKDMGSTAAFHDNDYMTWWSQWNGEAMTPETKDKNREEFESFYENIMDTLGIPINESTTNDWKNYIVDNVWWPSIQAQAGDRLKKLGINNPRQILAGFEDEGQTDPNVEGGEQPAPPQSEGDLNEEEPDTRSPSQKKPPVGSPGRDWHKKPTLREIEENRKKLEPKPNHLFPVGTPKPF